MRKLKIILLLSSIFNFYEGAAQNPFSSLGVKDSEIKLLTLSNGKYQEFITNDTLVKIGSVVINTLTGKIEYFVKTDTLYSESTLEPEVISRWLSPDPVVKPHESPYAAMSNNPIIYNDPDGRDPVVTITETETSVTITVTSYIYVVAKTKEQAQQVITQQNLDKIGSYLQGGTYSGTHNGKTVDINFATNVIAVEDKKEARALKESNGGAGVIAIYDESNERAFYNPNNETITFGNREDGRETGVFAHEVAHDFGLNERYIEMGGGLQAPLEDFWNDLMGTADYSFNQANIDNLVENALDTRKTKGDNFVDQFVNTQADNVQSKFKGQKKTVISYDPATKKPSEPKKTKDVQF